jgi:IS1 family transposase
MLGGFINGGSVTNPQNDYETIGFIPHNGVFVDLIDGNRDINRSKEWWASRKQHIAKNGICGGNRLSLVGYTPLFYGNARSLRIQHVWNELDHDSKCGAFADISSFHQQREADFRVVGGKGADQLETNGDPRPFSETELSSGLLSGFLHLSQLFFHQASLLLNGLQGANGYNNADNPDDGQYGSGEILRRQHIEIGIRMIAVAVGILGGFFWLLLIDSNRLSCLGRVGYWLVGVALLCAGFAAGLLPVYHRTRQDKCRQQNCVFHPNNVPRKYSLTAYNYWGTVIDMANVLNTDKQIAVIGALSEGSSIRSIERITGVHRDTIMRLGVKVGQGCAALMDSKMRDLSCNRLEMDEIWGFVGKKERQVREGDSGVGSVWTFCAIDAETKLVPAFKVGDRSIATATAFVRDVASRMSKRVQISTDGLHAYVGAIESAFGGDVDYAQIVKVYGQVEVSNNRRYSAPEFVSSEKKVIVGNPDERLISTSYIERLNATTRLHMRRLTRLTLAFSKKRENFEAAVALHFAYYNFVKRHNTIRCTPAMAAGVERDFWSMGNLLEAAA